MNASMRYRSAIESRRAKQAKTTAKQIRTLHLSPRLLSTPAHSHWRRNLSFPTLITTSDVPSSGLFTRRGERAENRCSNFWQSVRQ